MSKVKESQVLKKGNQFEITRTEVAVLDQGALEEHLRNLEASLQQCQGQKKHLQEWESAILEEVRQIKTLLGVKG